MKENRKSYRRLRRSAWLGSDYLLVVNARFFSEHYMRLYRGDIEAMMLYSLQRNRGTLLVFEWLCALVPLGFCAYHWWLHQSGNAIVGVSWHVLIPAIVFLAAYSAWRLAQPNWACVLSTRTSRAGLALGRTLKEAKRKFSELVAWVAQVQPPLMEMEGLSVGQRAIIDPKSTKAYTQAIHAAAFGCGALGWILVATGSSYVLGLAILALMAYYAFLVATYFSQAAFEFPFAVKSAAVMSQISAVTCVLLALSSASWMGPERFYFFLWGKSLAQFAGISAVSFSLYGIVAMTLATTELPSPGSARHSVLGLEG
ncbi:MAG TPA: hypothetical protein VHZ07_14395 [Bryobacteraceae bacterium]|jgi:hypothetical protein|nr:hypothetical protein [Bryobacteraceae bacterium]